MGDADWHRGSGPIGGQGVAGGLGRRAIAVLPGCPIDGPAAVDTVAGAYSAYHSELTAHLRRVTREAEVAEDLVQEAFLRLQRELLDGRTPDNPRAWLYRVAGNLAISRGRRLAVARRRLALTWLGAGEDESPESCAIRLERDGRLVGALRDLSPEARLGLMLAAQGFSGREVAAALGRSEVATRTLLCRARRHLRHRLLLEEHLPDDDR